MKKGRKVLRDKWNTGRMDEEKNFFQRCEEGKRERREDRENG